MKTIRTVWATLTVMLVALGVTIYVRYDQSVRLEDAKICLLANERSEAATIIEQLSAFLSNDEKSYFLALCHGEVFVPAHPSEHITEAMVDCARALAAFESRDNAALSEVTLKLAGKTCLLGASAFAKKNFVEAKQLWMQEAVFNTSWEDVALSQHFSKERCLGYLALAYLESKQFAECQALLEKQEALSLRPYLAAAYIQEASLLRSANSLQRAESLLENVSCPEPVAALIRAELATLPQTDLATQYLIASSVQAKDLAAEALKTLAAEMTDVAAIDRIAASRSCKELSSAFMDLPPSETAWQLACSPHFGSEAMRDHVYQAAVKALKSPLTDSACHTFCQIERDDSKRLNLAKDLLSEVQIADLATLETLVHGTQREELQASIQSELLSRLATDGISISLERALAYYHVPDTAPAEKAREALQRAQTLEAQHQLAQASAALDGAPVLRCVLEARCELALALCDYSQAKALAQQFGGRQAAEMAAVLDFCMKRESAKLLAVQPQTDLGLRYQARAFAQARQFDKALTALSDVERPTFEDRTTLCGLLSLLRPQDLAKATPANTRDEILLGLLWNYTPPASYEAAIDLVLGGLYTNPYTKCLDAMGVTYAPAQVVLAERAIETLNTYRLEELATYLGKQVTSDMQALIALNRGRLVEARMLLSASHASLLQARVAFLLDRDSEAARYYAASASLPRQDQLAAALCQGQLEKLTDLTIDESLQAACWLKKRNLPVKANLVASLPPSAASLDWARLNSDTKSAEAILETNPTVFQNTPNGLVAASRYAASCGKNHEAAELALMAYRFFPTDWQVRQNFFDSKPSLEALSQYAPEVAGCMQYTRSQQLTPGEIENVACCQRALGKSEVFAAILTQAGL